MLKFLVDRGIVTIRSTILIPAECATVTTSSKEILKEAKVRHENFKITLHPNFPDQEVAIRGTLSAKGRMELCSLLKENLDIFTWQPSDMIGVPRSVAEHQLNIREGYSLVRQKKWIIKDVHCLNGKLASLNRFISKSAEKSLSLFKSLKKCIKKSDFPGTSKAEEAFKQLKQHLSELPLLVAPTLKEELIVYLFASHGAISAVLMTERGMDQMPVYFVSRALQGPKPNYTLMEKLVLALVFAAKSVMLGEHNITYWPRISKKGQILVDFLVENLDEAPPDTLGGTEFTYALRFQFTTSNNEAEYEALIAGLWIAAQMGVYNVNVSVDSKLVANQMLGTYIAKEENMLKYLKKAKSLISGFANFSITQVPRNGTLPNDRNEASKLRIKARQYELLEGVLYRRSFLKLWLRYVGPLQANYVIREIHEGLCSMHAGPRSMVDKAMRLGYFWPTMQQDIRDMIRTCNNSQIHHPVPRNPKQPLTPITAPWSFYKWGIDIAGPFPKGPGKVKFLIVAMDYFTKWIEAKAMATITKNQVKKFVWDNIVCRFGLPGETVSDNGKQFNKNPFKDWCEKLNITQCFTLVKHP
ncbi:reverse transcriptase domain-containing protein [Tanacetum coccineum]|uniref:Reverse transcriptase domain-containing protein n=1 Tax=Tanacetum coccineum TaxID=301880 RepID=A0ABQ4XLX5_9ASTR